MCLYYLPAHTGISVDFMIRFRLPDLPLTSVHEFRQFDLPQGMAVWEEKST